MPLHSRPVPAPKTPATVAPSHVVTHLPQPEPPPAGRRAESDPEHAPSPAPETPARAAASDGSSLPWYRSEPWLAVMVIAFIPLLGAVVAPDAAKYPLIGLSGIALVSSAVMLVRQGMYRPRTGSAQHPG